MRTFDFKRFKRDINLTQYAAYLGYEIDRKRSTRNSIAMRKGNADKVIISKRCGYWVYFSVFDTGDNGTIIDFIKNRTNKSLFEIGTELNAWLGGGFDLPEPKSYIRDVEEKKPDPKRVKRLFTYCTLATNHTYLQGRGITEAVLRSPRFHGRIFQDRYGNAVFPHFKEGEVSGLELKGKNTGLLVRGSEKTLWRSNTRKTDDTLIISETPIDAISYQILHAPDGAFYTATCGGFSPQQAEIICQLVTRFPQIKRIVQVTDNDQGGDALSDRLNHLINKTGYQGLSTRHSPDTRGLDWNDVLKAYLNL